MAISVGDIYFTANFTDLSSDGATSESFSFVTTTDIAAGETITFHGPESAGGVGDTSFTYTVGGSGLSAFDRVTISESNSVPNTFVLNNDPSGGSTSGATGNGWSITDNDNIIAAQGGQVLAGINNSGGWDDNIAATGLSSTDLAAFEAANPTLASPAAENLSGGTGPEDNAIFTGTDITTQGDNPAFWDITDLSQSHSSPNIGGVTYATQDATINCFAAGTLIATPNGEVKVETLSPHDTILTADGGTTKVMWLAKQAISTRHGIIEKRQPVRIRAGALSNHTDLIVTADHGMIVDGFVINASALVNGSSIDWVAIADIPATFTVYHIETLAHDVILANGAASETFLDATDRHAFDNYAEYQELQGCDRIIPEMNRLRISSQRLVPQNIKTRLGIASTSIAQPA